MSKLSQDISHFKAILFDVDGVLSRSTVAIDADGTPQRTLNVKDGYSIRSACEKGIIVGLITGGFAHSTTKRYEGLGVKHIYQSAKYKVEALDDFIEKTGIAAEEIIFVGDDLPDYHVMERCGFAVAPADAVPEIRAIANYVSGVKGGEGVAREIIEELMKSKGLWMSEEAFGW